MWHRLNKDHLLLCSVFRTWLDQTEWSHNSWIIYVLTIFEAWRIPPFKLTGRKRLTYSKSSSFLPAKSTHSPRVSAGFESLLSFCQMTHRMTHILRCVSDVLKTTITVGIRLSETSDNRMAKSSLKTECSIIQVTIWLPVTEWSTGP